VADLQVEVVTETIARDTEVKSKMKISTKKEMMVEERDSRETMMTIRTRITMQTWIELDEHLIR
jgi:hypothetical protein